MTTQPQRFETARGTVHAWQLDHMGHINVRAYAEFFEEASWQFYNHIGISPSMLRAGKFHMAAVQQDTSYLKELHAGDVIDVHSRIVELREKVFKFEHELTNSETNIVCARSVFTVVCIDSVTRRSMPLPAEIMAKARAALGH